MQQQIGLTTIQIPQIKLENDPAIVFIAENVAQYLNLTIGDSWRELNGNDGYVVKNIHFINPALIDGGLNYQLPALFVYREKTEREKMTMFDDLLKSMVKIILILPMTNEYELEKRHLFLEKITKVVESLIRRNKTVTNNANPILSDAIKAQQLRVVSSKYGEYSSKYKESPNYLHCAIDLDLHEIVWASDEQEETLTEIKGTINVKEMEELIDDDFIGIGNIDLK